MPQDPRMAQWNIRFQQASKAASAAEASGDTARKKAAYENLRQVQMAKPAGQRIAPGSTPATKKKSAQPRPAGALSFIRNAMKGANDKAKQ